MGRIVYGAQSVIRPKPVRRSITWPPYGPLVEDGTAVIVDADFVGDGTVTDFLAAPRSSGAPSAFMLGLLGGLGDFPEGMQVDSSSNAAYTEVPIQGAGYRFGNITDAKLVNFGHRSLDLHYRFRCFCRLVQNQEDVDSGLSFVRAVGSPIVAQAVGRAGVAGDFSIGFFAENDVWKYRRYDAGVEIEEIDTGVSCDQSSELEVRIRRRLQGEEFGGTERWRFFLNGRLIVERLHGPLADGGDFDPSTAMFIPVLRAGYSTIGETLQVGRMQVDWGEFDT